MWVGHLNADRGDRSWIVCNPEPQLRFRVLEEWGVQQGVNLADDQQLLSENQIEIPQLL